MATESLFFDLYERQSVVSKRAEEEYRIRSTFFAEQVWYQKDLMEKPLGNVDRSFTTYNNLNKELLMAQPNTKLGGKPINAV